jgi:tRNA threonylcarbamoyladenosine biosynthesis protein TsaE
VNPNPPRRKFFEDEDVNDDDENEIQMTEIISHSPDETAALGEAWGRAAQRGLVIALSGDLGAGKTQLVKGLARGLGVTAKVHSPTFTIVNIYSGGGLPLFHLDLYRLESRGQILSAGLEEYLQPNGVAVIEWAERWFGNEHPTSDIQRPTTNLPRKFRAVKIETLSDNERRISYEDFGD